MQMDTAVLQERIRGARLSCHLGDLLGERTNQLFPLVHRAIHYHQLLRRRVKRQSLRRRNAAALLQSRSPHERPAHSYQGKHRQTFVTAESLP